MPSSWVDWLMELLCRIYKEWGGNCADLGLTPTDAIKQSLDTFNNNGLPSFPDPAKEEEFFNTVDAIEAHLDLPDNSLTTEDDEKLRQLIADMRAARP
jgi:hypothetical protein